MTEQNTISPASNDLASDGYNCAIAAIDQANSEDPNIVPLDGRERPAEVVYSERMTTALTEFCPGASEELRLAARGQHIRRWTIARADYEEGRLGYLKWRTALKRYHAKAIGEIMAECGYDQDQVGSTQSLIRKERLKQDADAQTLEDVICLVFLKYYSADFAAKHDRDKIISILRKTWGKMSQRGHEAALSLDLPPAVAALVGAALEGAG